MERFEIAKFSVEVEAVQEMDLPAYLGSTLRGAFGHAFRRVCCTQVKTDCASCASRDSCVYSYVFNTPPPADTEIMRLYPKAPHPFVVEPPLDSVRIVVPGQSLLFNLILIGKAIDMLPYFIHGFEEMGTLGLGRKRARFKLRKVECLTDGTPSFTVYDGRMRELLAPPQPVALLSETGQPPEDVTLKFLTPVRIKYNGKMAQQLDFHVFMRALLRRISSLAYFHCGLKVDWDFRGLIEKAESVKTVSSNLHWYDWQRYSSRQNTRMKLGGFMGKVRYQGEMSDLWDIIRLGEVVHVGKATTFGLGKYEIISET